MEVAASTVAARDANETFHCLRLTSGLRETTVAVPFPPNRPLPSTRVPDGRSTRKQSSQLCYGLGEVWQPLANVRAVSSAFRQIPFEALSTKPAENSNACVSRSSELNLHRLLLVTLLALSIQKECPAQLVTVKQLEQKLAAPSPPPPDHAVPLAVLQDATQATQIDNMQLSERLTSATLASILKGHTFGPRTQRELQLLADRSALLNPPASELPDRSAPDANQQQHMLDAARVWVFQTLTRLPNFFATRTTERFAGISPEVNKTGKPVQVGLFPRGAFTREITFRNGKEVTDPLKAQRSARALPQMGLESWGEFGPEPAIVLLGVSTGSITFHHWEQLSAGLAAVYRYSVPEEDSKYEVNYACNGSNAFQAQPGYHGSIAIDPVSGAILRLTLQADSKPDDPISHVASVIEYGPVDIGGRTYICPLHSLAFSVEEVSTCFRNLKDQALVHNRTLVQPLILNRTTFSDYHRLASTHKIITDAPETP